jgi:hypothetical protein
MVEVYFYGTLRRYAEADRAGQEVIIRAESGPADTMGSFLERIGVPVEEINHVFLNAKLVATRNQLVALYGYPQIGSDLSDWDLKVAIGDGDRVGLFGRDMAVLGM